MPEVRVVSHVACRPTPNDRIGLVDDRDKFTIIECDITKNQIGDVQQPEPVTGLDSRKMRRSVIISHSDHFECQRSHCS